MRTYENWVEFIHGWKRGGGKPPLVISVGEWIELRELLATDSHNGGRTVPVWPTPDIQILGTPIRLACPHDDLPPPPLGHSVTSTPTATSNNTDDT